MVGAAAAILALKPFSGGGKAQGSPSTTESTSTPTGTTSTTESTPPPPRPTKVCQNELTLEGYASYSLDECKANREGDVGIVEVKEKVFNGTKVAEWTGHKPPSISDCINSSSTSGVESVKLKQPGEWLCAEGSEHHVMRIRFDSFAPPANLTEGGVYRFFVDVYELPQG